MHFITLEKEQNKYTVKSVFASSAAFTLIFHFKLFSFVDGGRKNIFLAPMYSIP